MTLSKYNKYRNFNSVIGLTTRNVKLFFKDKVTVFFSLLAPILVFMIYVLFLGDIQSDAINNLIAGQFELDQSYVSHLANSWMIAGVCGVACLTVGLNSMLSIVYDKENSVINDFTASPVSTSKILLSYFLGGFIVTFSLVFVVLVIGVVYLGISSGVWFSASEIISLILILFVSALSAVMFMAFIMNFFSKQSSSAAFTGIFTALVGFLLGAYIPITTLPLAVQYIANLVPGSHSTALFRQVFLSNAIDNLPISVPSEFIDGVMQNYSFNLNMFGLEVSAVFNYIYLAVSVAVFFGLYMLVKFIAKKLNKKY